MANLVAVLTHCQRGDEVILGDQSHTFLYEAGGISSFGGVHSRQLKNHDDGTMSIEDIKSAIRKKDVHFPPSRLICLENTHNRCLGMPLDINYINDVADIAKNNNMSVHIDGARIFNAAVATGFSVSDLTKEVESVSFCLSKGLSAPSGSLLCGESNFIQRARFNRKALGGGMRQAGILAAAGIVALNVMSKKIVQDHQNAKKLADGISKIDGINLELEKTKTNIIYFKLDHPKVNSSELIAFMRKKNIRFFELAPNWSRLVTHSGISNESINYVVNEFDYFFAKA